MSNVELATAYVALVPSMQGAQGKIAEALLPASAEGDKAGQNAGSGFASGFSGVLGAAAIGAAAITAAAGGAAVGLYAVGSTFDDVADTIRVGTGASGEALTGLVDVAKQVGTAVPTSFETAGKTVSDLNQRLGLSGDTLSTVAQQYIQAGNILGQDVDIKSTTAAFSAFGIEGANVEGAMDSLFRVSQATGVGINDLASQVQTSGAALQNLGFGFDETAALAGSLSKAGLNTGAVMASMSKGLVTLAKSGEDPQKAFRRVTGELGEFVKKGDTAAALNLAGKVFGTKGATQLVGALQSGKINLDDLTKSAGLSSDTILGLGKDTADAAESWELVKNKALLALEPMGTAVFNFAGTQLGLLADNMDGIVANVTNFATEAGKVIGVLTTGDFTGPIFGLEEDSALVDFLFDIRDGVTTLGDAAKNAGSFVQTDLVPGLQAFGQWAIDNQATIANVATGITVLLLPAFVRLGVTALISGAQQVAAWVMSGTGAITTGATYVAQSYMIIARWVAMGAAAIVSGAQTVAIWTLYKVEAIKGAAAYALQSARVAAAWVAMSTAAVVSGIKTAAVWTGTVVARAAAGAASFAVQVARVIAGWVLMAVRATVQAARQAAAWVIAVGIPAVAAAITMGIQAAVVVACWVLMSVQAMANAVRMAAAWFIALGPIGWVIAAVIGLVALIIANWKSVVAFTTAAFGAIGSFLSTIWRSIVSFVSGYVRGLAGFVVGAWNNIVGTTRSVFTGVASFLGGIWSNIVRGASGMIGGLVGFFTGIPGQIWGALSGAGTWLFSAGANIVQGLLDGVRSLAGTIGNFFLSLLPGWIVEPFKIALNIHSPSRVFRDLGRQLPAGLVLGVEDGKEAIDASMRRMVTVPEIGGVGTGSARGSRVAQAGGAATEVNFNGPVYGDPQHIVDEMEARKRRASIRNNLTAITVA